MTSNFTIDVSESNFEYEVLAYSHQIPVVVDFWAPWCSPCRILGPILERLAEEAQGAFRLAKVNTDENPNLALRYNVRGIPAVKGFLRGEVVAEFVGAKPEPKVRAFLQQLAPSPTDLTLAKAISLSQEHAWAEAADLFQEVLETRPDEPQALLGYTQCLLLLGRAEETLPILQNFPPSRQYAEAETLKPLANALVNRASDDDDYPSDPILEATYKNALTLVDRGNIPAALDGMLDILRQDKQYRNGEVHKVVLALISMLGDDTPLARQYRSELASILF